MHTITTICLDIAKQDAINQVYAGSVKRVNVLIDEANPTLGPFALQLDMSDGSCRKLPRACGSGISSHSSTAIRSRDSRCPGAAASSASNATDFRAPSAISCPSGARSSNRPRRLTCQRSILFIATAARVRRTYQARRTRFSGFFTPRQTSVNRSCGTRHQMPLHRINRRPER